MNEFGPNDYESLRGQTIASWDAIVSMVEDIQVRRVLKETHFGCEKERGTGRLWCANSDQPCTFFLSAKSHLDRWLVSKVLPHTCVNPVSARVRNVIVLHKMNMVKGQLFSIHLSSRRI